MLQKRAVLRAEWMAGWMDGFELSSSGSFGLFQNR